MKNMDIKNNNEESLFGISEENLSLPVSDSLLSDSEAESGGSSLDSLLSADDTMTFTELNNDAMSQAQIEARKKYFSNPKNQAEILLQNYIKNSNVLVNRKQRNALYSQYYREAKKGKFNRMFYESIYGISPEEAKTKISKLND